MPSCLVRYRVTIVPRATDSARPLAGVPGIAVVDEDWVPDDFGDPGRCVRRRVLVELRSDAGGDYLDRGTGRWASWRVIGAKLDGPIRWASLSELDVEPA